MAHITKKINKSPTAKIDVSIDYKELMPDGSVITASTWAASPTSGLTYPPTWPPNGTKAVGYVGGGVLGDVHELTSIVNFDSGEILRRSLLITISEFVVQCLLRADSKKDITVDWGNMRPAIATAVTSFTATVVSGDAIVSHETIDGLLTTVRVTTAEEEGNALIRFDVEYDASVVPIGTLSDTIFIDVDMRKDYIDV